MLIIKFKYLHFNVIHYCVCFGQLAHVILLIDKFEILSQALKKPLIY